MSTLFIQHHYFAEKLYGKDNILSAVMHADEINLTLSDKYGYPVYHYHMHVMALPVVEKKVLWSKRCKDKSLIGTVKEIINQIQRYVRKTINHKSAFRVYEKSR